MLLKIICIIYVAAAFVPVIVAAYFLDCSQNSTVIAKGSQKAQFNGETTNSFKKGL